MEYIMYKWDLDRNWTARLSFMALKPVLKTAEDSLSLLPHLRDWTWTRVLCLTPWARPPVQPRFHYSPLSSTIDVEGSASDIAGGPSTAPPSLVAIPPNLRDFSFLGNTQSWSFWVFFLSAHVFLLSRDLIWERMWLWLVPRHFKEKTGFKSVKFTCLNLLIDCCSLNRLTLWRM